MDLFNRPSRRSLLAATGTAAVVGAAFAGTSHADESGQVPKSLKPGGELDQYIEELSEADQFSGTVGIHLGSRRVYQRSFGLADRDEGVPNEADTIYALASITKMLTGAAVAQLAEQGALDLDDAVGKHLDGFTSDVADGVTLHHLLTHTSGLGDYRAIEGFQEEAPTWNSAAESWDGIMRYVRLDTLQAVPGSAGIYSNTGFTILGAVVEAASGQSYYDYMREHVFAALGMGDTDFYTRDQWRDDPRIAKPYVLVDGERVNAIDDNDYLGFPDGGAFSTSADLRRFTDALHGGEILSPAFTRVATGPASTIPPLVDPPVPSFDTYTGPGRITEGQWLHAPSGGSTAGASADLLVYPDTNWTVTILSHFEAGTTEPVAQEARLLILTA